ncbi:MAG: penicillin-binding protein activator [Alphaproteobacteria bacterium]
MSFSSVRAGLAFAGRSRRSFPDLKAFAAPWGVIILLLLAACADEASLPSQTEEAQRPAPDLEALASVLETPREVPEPVIEEKEVEIAVLTPTVPELPRETLGVFGPLPVKVGLLLPLTGRGQAEGIALLEAAQLALFDIGADNLVLMPRDTGGSPGGATRAAQDVIAEGAELIIGPLFSEEVRAIAPMAQQAGVNVVAFSTDPRAAEEGIYLIGFTSRQQVERVVEFAWQQGADRFAALAPSNAYGRAVTQQMISVVEELGATVAGVGFYQPDGGDAAEVVRRIADYDRRHQALLAERKELRQKDDEVSRRALARLKGLDTLGDPPFDALLLADGGHGLKTVAPLIPYYDIDPVKVRLLGTGLWDDPAALEEPNLVGGWFVSATPANREGFVDRYTATYGHPPLRLATLAYDATAVAAVLGRFAGGADYSAAALRAPSGFAGVDGIFRFGTDGLAERGLAVLEILPQGGTAVVSEAPVGFRVTGP